MLANLFFVFHSYITENFSFVFADCTDSEFAEITDVNIDDNYTKSLNTKYLKTYTLNATELNSTSFIVIKYIIILN